MKNILFEECKEYWIMIEKLDEVKIPKSMELKEEEKSYLPYFYPTIKNIPRHQIEKLKLDVVKNMMKTNKVYRIK